MPMFKCERCRQALHISSPLSDDVALGGTLTQSSYDVIHTESVLVQDPTLNAKDVNRAAGLDKWRRGEDGDGRDSGNELSGGTTLSSLSPRTTSLFDMLSTTTPPRDWMMTAKEKASLASMSSTSSSWRDKTVEDRKSAARLPLGHNGDLRAAVDHPLCRECASILIERSSAQLEELKRERDGFVEFEKRLREADELDEGHGGPRDLQSLIEEIDLLKAQAEIIEEETAATKAERAKIQAELDECAEDERKLEEEEKGFWEQYSKDTIEVAKLAEKRSAIETALGHDTAMLHRLNLTNVYNDAFCIGHEGRFHTINGLRFGRLPSSSSSSSASGRGGRVDWPEINAAWGQVAFLLTVLAKKGGLSFRNWKIHPQGSFSTIEKVTTKNPTEVGRASSSSNGSNSSSSRTTYTLYAPTERRFYSGLVSDSRPSDEGMIAFLDCLKEISEWASSKGGFRLDHSINGDKIGDASIKYSSSNEEGWTKALGHVLQTLQTLLQWMIKMEEERRLPT